MKPLLIVGLVLVGMVACGDAAPDRRQVLVSAAASLSDAFAAIEVEFENDRPDIDVVINLGGSSALREQILAGAPVDVFASANPVNMTKVVEGGFVSGNVLIFATNSLAIAVPSGNPSGIVGLEDFANPDYIIGLCAAAVPCGDFARRALDNAGVEPVPDTNEPDVRALLTKIEADELDAGIVYATDIAARQATVSGVDIPEEFNVTAEYPIAMLSDGENQADAEEFVGFVLSPAGQAILRDFGFTTP
jgi:molybdate transport system substrate-binding protein